MYRMSPAQKAARTRAENAARKRQWAAVERLGTIPSAGDGSMERAALEVVRTLKLDSDDFWALDNGYGAYGSDRRWHSVLRSTRNHPQYGPELFDLLAKHTR